MQKLTSTHSRIADLGKPRVVIIGGGLGGLDVTDRLNNNQFSFPPLLYQEGTSALLKPFHDTNKGNMATVGRNRAVVDLTHYKTSVFAAWAISMFVNLISFVGSKNKFFVFLSWLWSYFSYDKSNRIIIARPKDGVN